MLLSLLQGLYPDDQSPTMIVCDALGAVVSQTSQTSGFPASSLANPLTYERWQPLTYPASAVVDYGDAVTVDAICLAAVSADISGVVVASSTDGVNFTNQAFPAVDGGDVLLVRLPGAITTRYWRLTIGAGSVSVFIVGSAGVLPCQSVDTTPLRFSRDTELLPNKSNGGQWLGRSVTKKGLVGQIVIQNESHGDFDTGLNALLKRARFSPFVYSNPVDGAFYCWTTSDPQASRGSGRLISVTIPVEAYSSE